jgi:hypothetical protein
MVNRILLLTLLTLLTSACETVSIITIEVKRPAEFTLPEHITKVVVVNNTLTQPATYGHTASSFGGNGIETSQKTEELPGLFVSNFAKVLTGKGLFKVVTQKGLPEKSFLEDTPLNEQQMDRISDSEKPDLVISLDRFLVESVLKINYVATENSYKVTMDGRCFPVVRIYDLHARKVIFTSKMQDTLYWENYDMTSEGAISHFPATKTCMEDLTMYSVDQLHKKLFPNSEKVQRFLYVGMNRNMRDAYNYVLKDKWEEATYIWEYLYESTKNEELKAYCAANLALRSEILDNFDRAIECVDISKSLFENSNSLSMRCEAPRMGKYSYDLKVRASQIELLEKQLKATKDN